MNLGQSSSIKPEPVTPKPSTVRTIDGRDNEVPTLVAADNLIAFTFEAGTTGPKGGDGGHGAATYLRFQVTGEGEGGRCQMDVRTSEDKVELFFYGDWEIDGVKNALRHMLKTLEAQTAPNFQQGVVTSWNTMKRVGTIALRDDASQRFFFFGSRILSGPEPVLGSLVVFERSVYAPQPNKLPLADHIHVVDSYGGW